MHLPELAALAPIAKVDGLALAIYRTNDFQYGWVLAAACHVVTWDGWYTPAERPEHLPLLDVLEEPETDGVEEARMANIKQLSESLAVSGHPLVESGLDSMPARAEGGEHPQAWGPVGLAQNGPFRTARIVAVASLGSAPTLRWAADLVDQGAG